MQKKNLKLSIIFNNLIKIYTAQNIKIKFDTLKVIEFLNKRFEILLLEKGYELNIVRGCLQQKEFDPLFTLENINKLNDFLISKEGADFLLNLIKGWNQLLTGE